MITVKNYKEKTKGIDFSKLPEPLQKSHRNYNLMVEHYDTNDAIKNVIDLYLSKLNEYLKKNKDTGKQKKAKKPEKTNVSKKAEIKKVEKKPTLKALEIRKFNDGFEWLILDYKTAKLLFEEAEIEVFLVDFDEQTEHIAEYVEDLNEDFELAVEYNEAKKHYKIELKTKQKGQKNKKTKEKLLPKKVEDVAIELRFIKRYTLLHGKVKSKKQILTLLASLQNAILKKQIRKTSPFAKEIEHIQDELISLLSLYGKNEDSLAEITIKKSTLEAYRKIASSEKVMPAVRFIARYNRLQGKHNVKRKAEKLLNDIEKALEKNKIEYYKKEVKEIQEHLKDYVCNDNGVLDVEDRDLSGISKKKLNSSSIISSTTFEKNVKFKPLGFTGKWRELIGDPVKPFSMMTYAKPGQGKSTMNILFANYLASKHNKKVLFVADEEKLGYTLQEKLKRLKASHPNLFITDELPDNLKQFDFVVVDSVNSIGLTPEELEDLREANPETSFLYIFQSTKDGNFKGSQEFSHDVDVVITVNNGIASTEKSRFGGNGEIQVY